MTLSTQQLNKLEYLSEIGDRIGYYTALAAWGYSYGLLALEVVNADSLSGAAANIFLKNNAGVSVSNDLMAQISIDLMRQDLAARRDNGGNDIGWQQIQVYHQDVFGLYNVSVDAWTPNLALNLMANDSDRDALWSSLISESRVESIYAVLETAVVNLPGTASYVASLVSAGIQSTDFQSNWYGNYDLSIGNDARVTAGDPNANTISGTASNDIIMGFDGDDTINGGAGDDRIYGGEGDDVIDGGKGNDVLYGGGGDDTFNLSSGVDHIFGGEGDDTFNYSLARLPRAFVAGGAGNDTFNITGPSSLYLQSIDLEEWDQYIYDSSPTILWGGDGADTFNIIINPNYDNKLPVSIHIIYDDLLTEDNFMDIDYKKLQDSIINGDASGWQMINIINPDPSDIITINGYQITGASYGIIYENYQTAYYGYHNQDYGYIIDTTEGAYNTEKELQLTVGLYDDTYQYYLNYFEYEFLNLSGFNNGDFGIYLTGNGPTYIRDYDAPPGPNITPAEFYDETRHHEFSFDAVVKDYEPKPTANKVIGTPYNDTLNSTGADDSLRGLEGDDTYNYAGGGGHDTIWEGSNEGSADKLMLSGIEGSRINISRVNDDLVLSVAESAAGANDAGSVTIKNSLGNTSGAGVELFVVGDQTYTRADIQWMLLNQTFTPNADTIAGFKGTDDYLAGGAGDDTYIYKRGGGHDIIEESVNGGTADKLVLHGLSGNDVGLSRSENDLVISVWESSAGAGDGGSITIKSSLGNASDAGLELFTTTDGSYTRADIHWLLLNQATTANADIIEGFEASHDYLTGGAGDDTFVFKTNFGWDTISDFQAGVGTDDVIEFHDNLFADFQDVLASAAQDGNDTVIAVDSGNGIILKDVLLSNLHQDDFRFVA